jgi:hypothetical protein
MPAQVPRLVTSSARTSARPVTSGRSMLDGAVPVAASAKHRATTSEAKRPQKRRRVRASSRRVYRCSRGRWRQSGNPAAVSPFARCSAEIQGGTPTAG